MKTKTDQFRVSGMTCASCELIIARTLSKIDGVASVNVSLASETANVEYDESSVTVEQMNNALKSHGYELHTDGQEKTKQPGSGVTRQREEEMRKVRKEALPAFVAAVFVFVVMILEILFSVLGKEFFLPMRPWRVVQFFIATFVLFFSGRRFFEGIWRFVRHGNADMNSLVGIGTVVAYMYSTLLLLLPEWKSRFGLPEDVYFDATIIVIGFVLFGKYLEVRSKLKTGEAIEALMKLQARVAHVRRDGAIIDVSIDDVKVGDVCVVKVGESIPVDGEVLDGTSHIDESMITGESIPVKRTVGDTVIGATINTEAVLAIKTKAVGGGTVLSQIIRMVQQAQGSKPPIQRFADVISSYFVPTVLVIAVLSVVLWLVLGGRAYGTETALPFAVSALVGVLVIACPCALGLATPTAIIVSTGTAARNGLLIKNAESLERAHTVNTVVFDKTGTLTEGKPKVTDVIPSQKSNLTQKQLLTVSGSLEMMSSHPLGAAIVRKSQEESCPIGDVVGATEIAGSGIVGEIQKQMWRLGTIKFLKNEAIVLDNELVSETQRLQSYGKTVVHVAQGKEHVGILALADVVKQESIEGVSRLKKRGVHVVMMTGDNNATAQAIASEVGIDEVLAEVRPEEKANEVKKLQKSGRTVAMVGDGINDAPALAQADIGIAMSTGTDVAIESADITILHGDIRKVVQALSISKRTLRVIKQNLFWAFFYNVVGIPLAAGLFYPFFGIMLSPVFAGMAMAFSSVSVLTNSLRLRRL